MSCDLELAEVENRFTFHPANSEGRQDAHNDVREGCRELAVKLYHLLPNSREKSLAITALDDCQQWGNAAIARHWDEAGE